MNKLKVILVDILWKYFFWGGENVEYILFLEEFWNFYEKVNKLE